MQKISSSSLSLCLVESCRECYYAGKTHKTVNNKRFERQMSNDENGIYVEKSLVKYSGWEYY